MKKWNNPELKILGVENTNEDELTVFTTIHHCHKMPNGSCGTPGNDDDNATANHNKPSKPHIWTGLACPDHQKGNGGGNGESACCCYGLS